MTPRNDTLTPMIWTEPRLVACSPLARLLYLGLGNFTNRDGRTVFDPRRLKMQILPDDPVDAESLFDELAAQGLVHIREKNGIPILELADLSLPAPARPQSRRRPMPSPDHAAGERAPDSIPVPHTAPATRPQIGDLMNVWAEYQAAHRRAATRPPGGPPPARWPRPPARPVQGNGIIMDKAWTPGALCRP